MKKVKKIVKGTIGQTQMESLVKIQKNKRFVWGWAMMTIILLGTFYVTGFIYTAVGFTTHTIIYVNTLYIIPLFFVAGFLGSNVPGISRTWGRMFQYSVIGVLILMTIYVVFMIITIIIGTVGPTENWIMLIIVITLDCLIYIGAIASWSWTRLAIGQYPMAYENDKSWELTKCFSLRTFLLYPSGKYVATQRILDLINLFLIFGVGMTAYFGFTHYLASVVTHYIIWITLFFTIWAIFHLKFYSETLNRVDEERGSGVIAMTSMITLGLSVIGFTVVLVYYVIMLTFFGSVVCCTTPTLTWMIWGVMIFNIIQAFLYVITGAQALYFMYKYDWFTNLRGNFEDRGEFLTSNMVGDSVGRSSHSNRKKNGRTFRTSKSRKARRARRDGK